MEKNFLNTFILNRATFFELKIYIFDFIILAKSLSFLSNLLSIENDLSTTAEVGRAFCNSA